MTRLVRRTRLLLRAWRLVSLAQALRSGARLEEVRNRMTEAVPPTATVSTSDALWASAWAARIGRRLLGRLDTCLVRALVAGSLIGDHEVTLCIGVHRPWATGDLLDAHAWVTVGESVPEPQPAASLYERVFTLPFRG